MVSHPFVSHNYANVTMNLLCLNKQSDVIALINFCSAQMRNRARNLALQVYNEYITRGYFGPDKKDTAVLPFLFHQFIK